MTYDQSTLSFIEKASLTRPSFAFRYEEMGEFISKIIEAHNAKKVENTEIELTSVDFDLSLHLLNHPTYVTLVFESSQFIYSKPPTIVYTGKNDMLEVTNMEDIEYMINDIKVLAKRAFYKHNIVLTIHFQ
jgi:hypothetical protein